MFNILNYKENDNKTIKLIIEPKYNKIVISDEILESDDINDNLLISCNISNYKFTLIIEKIIKNTANTNNITDNTNNITDNTNNITNNTNNITNNLTDNNSNNILFNNLIEICSIRDSFLINNLNDTQIDCLNSEMVKNNCKMKVKIHPEKNEILIKTLNKDKIENSSNLKITSNNSNITDNTDITNNDNNDNTDNNLQNTNNTNNTCCRDQKVKNDNILCECNINDNLQNDTDNDNDNTDNLQNDTDNDNDNTDNDTDNTDNDIIRGKEFSSLINEIVKSDNITFDDSVNFTNEFINDNSTITQMSNGIISNCYISYIIIFITIILVIF
ncbi:hypothetical protein EHP00_2480 [Ecytonucleospora hepatopenaei]|uniref:Uncharacterized protein n=1 Tax=Ecytonucleospora hepatopenaei TaxID=646526 RepID=A0A1W0E2Q4_9MICR|nr:hypothetical protein EHP00_2480 [Ecytonucleospora hepatopenaei]